MSETEAVCPFASNSNWFVKHPHACRRCSGDGWVIVGGSSADPELKDARRDTCQHCGGSGIDPCYTAFHGEPQPKTADRQIADIIAKSSHPDYCRCEDCTVDECVVEPSMIITLTQGGAK